MLSQGFNYRMKGAEASAGVISRKKTIFPKQSTFEAGNKIELLIPNIPRSFLDLKNSYLKFFIGRLFLLNSYIYIYYYYIYFYRNRREKTLNS